MIAFLCLIVGFLVGALVGIIVSVGCYREQIEKHGIVTARSAIYKVTKMEAKSEK
jgi:hypothetical protein